MKAHNCLKRFLLIALIAALFPFEAALGAQQRYDIVRVKLTNLKVETRLHIGVYGSYLVDGQLSFQRGSEIEAELKNGRIWLYHAGLCYQAGPEVRFARHKTGADMENGLRLQHGLNLFEGDLVLTARDGKIEPVLAISTEDYLKGVVPYEMNDSFPEEALKAQTVAARTYALNNLKPNAAYDVVDNTNDQVFRGYDANNQQAIKAIKATEGLCGVYMGKLATCYYTASNGGRTMTRQQAWGKTDVGYLQEKEDPYDVDNPESPVKTALLLKKPLDGLVGTDAFTAHLLDGMRAALHTLGCNTADGSYRVGEISGVELVEGKHGANAAGKMLRIILRPVAQKPSASGTDGEISLFSTPSPTAAPSDENTPKYLPPALLNEKITVDVPVFPDAEQALQLSINLSQNEVVSVEEKDDAFIIAFRRYGHGVGMSQRGAQQMAAKHGFNYRDILSFYYPGMELQKYPTIAEQREEMPVSYLTTPGPIPTATPRPTLMPVTIVPKDGQWLATVTGISATSSLNLRSMPDTSGEVLKQLYYGQKLLVLERVKEGWLHVQTDDVQGYVMEKFVHALPKQ